MDQIQLHCGPYFGPWAIVWQVVEKLSVDSGVNEASVSSRGFSETRMEIDQLPPFHFSLPTVEKKRRRKEEEVQAPPRGRVGSGL